MQDIIAKTPAFARLYKHIYLFTSLCVYVVHTGMSLAGCLVGWSRGGIVAKRRNGPSCCVMQGLASASATLC